MRRYYITDRNLAGGIERLVEKIAHNLAIGLDMIQIREKDLSAGDLLTLTRTALALPNPYGTRILVNERVDVALAAGAHGVHLPSRAIPPDRIREIVPAGFLVGVSCHDHWELTAAERAAADFVVYGPVFPPRSKPGYSAPIGLEGVREAVKLVNIPLFALGGIDEHNAPLCVESGAAGVAAITLFQK